VTGLETITVADPLFPSLVAVMVAVPMEMPLTNPLAATLATAELLLDHVNVRPVSTLPAASLTVTKNPADWPTERAQLMAKE